jgi:hypothetical protein
MRLLGPNEPKSYQSVKRDSVACASSSSFATFLRLLLWQQQLRHTWLPHSQPGHSGYLPRPTGALPNAITGPQ